MNALRARSLTKRYGRTAVVNELDLTVERGELYGFLGPNGAGKTTTIRMALGLIHPSGGDVELLGERAGSHGHLEALSRVGALIEEPGFYRYLSGRRNLICFARAGGSRADVQARLRRVEPVLEQVGLADARNKRVKAYSQGMRQRLGIAQALLGRPDVLVLDEPTNGLDPQGMREIRMLLRGLADDGTTVFVSSHLLSEVEAMCDRVGVLSHGRLVAEGPPSNLRGSVDRLRVEVDDPDAAMEILEAIPGARLVDRSGGVIRLRLDAPATPGAINSALVRGGVEVSGLAPERDTLEDVFLSLVEDAGVPG
ncbi:MAG: ABC transporter ATP-binding protein [Actinomycetota bacterium]|nr:ABC transporter ATP-binding protein [Actinomycetota bacterium]